MISALALQSPEYHARRTPRSRVTEFIATTQQDSRQVMEDRDVQLKAMIEHDVSRHFDGSMEKAVGAVKARLVNVVGLEDHMVTPGPAIQFAALIGADSIELDSDCGHLSPGCEAERLAQIVKAFLE